MRSRLLTILSTALIATAASAQDSSRVLIPIFYNGPGAHDSTWKTELGVMNSGTTTYRTPEVHFTMSDGCVGIGPCTWDRVDAGLFGRASMSDAGQLAAPAGLFMQVPEGQRDSLTFSLRVASRIAARDFWTEVPVVDLAAFRPKALWLPNVPSYAAACSSTGVKQRLTLRIYDADGLGGRVRVNVYPRYSYAGMRPFTGAEFDLSEPDAQRVENGQPLYPAFAQVRIDEVFSSVICLSEALRIEAVPLPRAVGPELRIWAFLTMTDNQTNQVTVLSPQ